jgi:hypothetical protein
LMKNKQLKFFRDSELISELLTFGIKKKKEGVQTYESLGKHDDMVMSLCLACYVADLCSSNYAFTIV